MFSPCVSHKRFTASSLGVSATIIIRIIPLLSISLSVPSPHPIFGRCCFENPERKNPEAETPDKPGSLEKNGCGEDEEKGKMNCL